MPAPRRIVLGVCGGIAAYKSVYLLRLLRKSGADVRVIMTPSARDFVGPVTFSALSGHDVHSDLISKNDAWNNHVELAEWAEHIIIAPATAHTIAKLAHGECDNLLLAVCLSARCPISIAPAMDLQMWKHKATRDNIEQLKQFGYHVLPVGDGELASGLEGEGRMLEPEQIMKVLTPALKTPRKNSKPIQVLITAGPSYEPVDAVRFIGNRSSGKMGIALAQAFAERDTAVTLVLGPTWLDVKDGRISVIRVSTADEMAKAALDVFPTADIIVAAAAVADFKPKTASIRKLKKEEGTPTIELENTVDILREMGKHKKRKQLLAGFALETNNELANARKKLKAKNLDLIVLNSLNDVGAGFGHDTNKVTLIWRNNKVVRFGLMLKVELANKLADLILKQYA